MNNGSFEIFRSRNNANHYVALRTGDKNPNATAVRTSKNLSIFTTIADDGTHHIGFDPAAARAAIAEHGFYAFEVTVAARDGLGA
ncbi:MAG TPA: hypothetical protein VFB16_04200 [Bauldia sp.]|nr:hypothetical protein [Bauldia sp.]